MSEIYLTSTKVKNMYLNTYEKLLKCILYSNTKATAIGDSINIVKEIINSSDSIKDIIVKNEDKSIEFKNNSESVEVNGNTSDYIYYDDNECFDNTVKSFYCAKENL